MPRSYPCQRGPGHIGAPAVSDEKHPPGVQFRLVQKLFEQSAAALLHTVGAGDEAPRKLGVTAAAQHGVDLRLRQVHIGNIVEFFALLRQFLHSGLHRRISRAGGQLGSALLRGVITRKAGPGVDFRQRYFPAFSGAGFALGPGAGGIKRLAPQAEKIRRRGSITLDERVKHVESHRVIPGGHMADVFRQIHGRYGVCGWNLTPAAKPFQMILMRSARRPWPSRKTCTVCQASFASSHSQPMTPSRR